MSIYISDAPFTLPPPARVYWCAHEFDCDEETFASMSDEIRRVSARSALEGWGCSWIFLRCGTTTSMIEKHLRAIGIAPCDVTICVYGCTDGNESADTHENAFYAKMMKFPTRADAEKHIAQMYTHTLFGPRGVFIERVLALKKTQLNISN